jgi:hypothetical protein
MFLVFAGWRVSLFAKNQASAFESSKFVCDAESTCVCSDVEKDALNSIQAKDEKFVAEIRTLELDYIVSHGCCCPQIQAGQWVSYCKGCFFELVLWVFLSNQCSYRMLYNCRSCESSCQAIGRVTGSCNAGKRDRNCSVEKVTPRQYALCQDNGVCSDYCMKKGHVAGECFGANDWDCHCVTHGGEGRDCEV